MEKKDARETLVAFHASGKWQIACEIERESSHAYTRVPFFEDLDTQSFAPKLIAAHPLAKDFGLGLMVYPDRAYCKARQRLPLAMVHWLKLSDCARRRTAVFGDGRFAGCCYGALLRQTRK